MYICVHINNGTAIILYKKKLYSVLKDLSLEIEALSFREKYILLYENKIKNLHIFKLDKGEMNYVVMFISSS